MLNRKKTLLRTVLSYFCAVLLALALPLCVLVGVLGARFSDTQALSEALVDEEYLAKAEQSALGGLSDVALLYGVEESVLTEVLPSYRGELREQAVQSTKSLFDFFIYGSEYRLAEISPELFEKAVADYARELVATQEDAAVRDGAVEEISADCAGVLSSAASPIGNGMFLSVLKAFGGVIPARLVENLQPLFFALLCLCLLLIVSVWFLQERGRRFFFASGALFCAATLLFVPSFFLLSGINAADLALAEGVLSHLVQGAFSRFLLPLRIGSAVLFGTSTLLLAASIVLCLKRQGAAKCEGEEDTDQSELPFDSAEEKAD